MVSRSTKRGFTFVEVSLAMGLTLGLLTLIGIYFSRGQRYAAETRAYAEAQSSATNLMRRISDELYKGAYSHRKPEANGIVFLSYGAVDNETSRVELERTSGRIAWKKWVGFFHNPQQKTVYQGVLPLTTTLFDLAHSPDPEITFNDFVETARVTPLPGKVRNFSIRTLNHRVQIDLTTEALVPVTGSDNEREIVVKVSGEVAIYN